MLKQFLIAAASLTLAVQLHAGTIPATTVLESGTGSIFFEDIGGGVLALTDDANWTVAGTTDEAQFVVEGSENAAGQIGLDFASYAASRLLPPGSVLLGLSDEYSLEGFLASGNMFSAVLKDFGLDERGVLEDGAKLVVTSDGFAFATGGLTEIFDFFSANANTQPDYDVQFTVFAAVAPVPLPASTLLLVSGVGGLIMLRRRESA